MISVPSTLITGWDQRDCGREFVARFEYKLGQITVIFKGPAAWVVR